MTDTPDIERIIAACEQDVAEVGTCPQRLPCTFYRAANARLALLGGRSVALARKAKALLARLDCGDELAVFDTEYDDLSDALLAWCQATVREEKS